MKKIIGIILIILLSIAFWVGLSFLFYNGGLGLLMSIILPLCIFIASVLIVVFVNLIGRLLS